MTLLNSVPIEALLFILFVVLAGMVWLIVTIRRRLRPKPIEDGWRQLEERVQELKQRKQG